MGIKIDFPEQCELGQSVTMKMLLGTWESGTDSSVVFITSTGFEIEGERWRPASRPPVEFELVPREPGLQFIEVELFHGTSRVGYVVVETEVV